MSSPSPSPEHRRRFGTNLRGSPEGPNPLAERETASRISFVSSTAQGAALLTLLLFAITGTPGLAWFDGGDFTTAAAELGVGHPTGFPSYTLVGHLATLVPLGGIAGRLAWLSALILAAGAYGIARLAVEAAGERRALGVAAALVTPLVLWAIPTVAIHGQVPEVYAGNVAIAALIAWTAHRAHEDARYLGLTAVGIGLGLTHHVIFGLLGPIAFVGAAWPHRRRPATVLVAAGLGAGVGLAYLYLVAAASAGPWHNWGDPSTLGRLIAHMTGASIRGAFADEMMSGPYATLLYGRALWMQLPVATRAIAAVGGVGLIGGAVRGVPGARISLAYLLADLGYSVWINPMGIRDLQCGQVGSVVLVVAGAWTILGSLDGVRARRGLGVPVLIGAAAALAATLALSGHPRGSDWSADDVLAYHLGHAAPESLTATLGDATTGAVIYGQVVLRARPDAAFFGRSLVSSGPWIAQWAAHQPIALAPETTLAAWSAAGDVSADDTIEGRFATIVGHQPPTRTIYWEIAATQMEIPSGYFYLPDYPFGAILRDDDPRGASEMQRLIGAAQDGWGPPTIDGPDYRRWLAGQYSAMGAMAYYARELPLTAAHFARAVELAPDRAPNWTNLGVVLAATGRLPEALEACREALAVDPMSTTALRNGIGYAEALGETETAETWRQRLGRLER